MQESIGGASDRDRVDHELKKALQEVIERECGSLMSMYGFYLRQVVSSYDLNHESYKFAAELYSRQLNKSFCCKQEIARTGVYSMLSMNYKGNLNADSAPVFRHLFHKIAQNINHEIEKVSKNMPVMTQGGNSMSYTSTNAPVTFLREMYMGMTAAAPMPPEYTQSIQDKIVSQYNSDSVAKKSKFEHIDALISSSKMRLVGYARPRFDFKYF